MKKHILSALLSFLFIILVALPSFGVSKETIQMMTQLDALQQEVQSLQHTVDTQTAIIKTLIQQTSASVDAMKASISKMQESEQRNLADTGNRFDAMTGQIQQLSASLDETRGQLSKLSDQVAQTQKIIQTINTQPPSNGAATPNGAAAPGANGAGSAADAPAAAAPAPPPAPDPQTLYNSAYSDYTQGHYELAIQGFQQYLQNYSDTDLASNAQFYVGDSYYDQKDYKNAIKQYDQCIQSYPKGNKAAAAYLKKGYALLALNQRTAGERELSLLLRKYPSSHEADLAKERLHRLRLARQ
ncbi:MAG: tol-pal system protein YbgF [Terriglobia bacterium]